MLDLGCGCGYGSGILQDAGLVVTGLDISEDAISYARRYYGGPDYQLCDVMGEELETDVLVAFEIIEHLTDPLSLLRRVRAKQMIVSTPNEKMYPFRPRDFGGDEYPHQRHYRPDELRTLIREAGYVPRETWCQKNKVADVTEGEEGIFLVMVADG